TDATMLWAHMHDAPPKVTAARRDLPQALDAVVARMLAKAPHDRYPTCGAALAACRVALGGGTQSAPRPRRKAGGRLPLAIAGVGVVAAIAAAVLFATDSSPARSAATPPGTSESHAVGKAVPLALVRRTTAVPQRRKPLVKRTPKVTSP